MGTHYENFYQDSKDLWDKNSLNVDTLFSNTDDHEISELFERTTPDDEDRREREQNVLKQKEGKPEGARYCFLDTLDQTHMIGLALEELVNRYDEMAPKVLIAHALNTLQYQILENTIDKQKLLNDLISLRYQAIKSGKYKVNGYKQPIKVELLLDAAARHYLKYSFGDFYDEESGYLHLSHLLANVLLIRYQIRNYYER